MEPNAPIKFRVGCPSCHTKFLVAERMLGLGVKCPKCGSHFRIPSRQSAAIPVRPRAASPSGKPGDYKATEARGGPSDDVMSTPQSEEVPGARGMKLALWAVIVVIVVVAVLGVLLGPMIPGSLSDRRIGMGIGDRTAPVGQEAEARMAAEMAKVREQMQMAAPPPMPPRAATDLAVRPPTVSPLEQGTAGVQRGGSGAPPAGTGASQGAGASRLEVPSIRPSQDKSGVNTIWFVLSQDGQHYACVVGRRFNCRVVLDGQEGKSYQEVWSLAISPDGRHVAYSVALSAGGEGLTEGQVVVVDGKEGPTYDLIQGTPVFSPDSRRVAYVGSKDGRLRVVLDGKEYKEYPLHGIDEKSLTFSPDSRRFAYIGVTGEKDRFVVIDRKECEKYRHVEAPVFSADSKRLAYVAVHHSGGNSVVVNGEIGPKYDMILEMSFSLDGKRLTYMAQREFGWSVVLDGRELGEGTYPVFSPDSKRFAYVVTHQKSAYPFKKAVAVVDGTEHQEHDEIIGDKVFFSPDSRRVAYVVKSRDSCFVVIDGQKQYPLASPDGGYTSPVFRDTRLVFSFSPDSQHVAYVATQGNKQWVVVDGKPGKAYSQIEDGPYFSPDSRHVAYLDVEGEMRDLTVRRFLVVAGIGGIEYRLDTHGLRTMLMLNWPPERRVFFDGVRAAYVWTVFDGAVHKIEMQLTR